MENYFDRKMFLDCRKMFFCKIPWYWRISLKYDLLFSQCLQCQGHKKKQQNSLALGNFAQICTFELNFLVLGDFVQISCFPLSLVWKYEKIPKICPVLLSAIKYNFFENNCDKMGDIIPILVSAIKCYFYFRSSVRQNNCIFP